MKITQKAFLPLSLVVFVLGIALLSPSAHAQTTLPADICYSFSSNIKLGQQDSASNSDVASLQRYLADQGYLNVSSLGTGHFGPLTFRAVQRFQAAHGVPATGFVGSLTRAAIAKAQVNCGISLPNSSPATLYSLGPSQGPVGTEISIRGFGFSDSNTILIDGMVAQRNVPITSSYAIACTTDPSCHGGINQIITFKLPEYVSPNCPVGSMCPMYMRQLTAGTTTISVQNGSGESNKLNFTITK